LVFILASILAPFVTPQDPYDLEKLSLDHFLKPPIWMEGGEAPFLLGTDDQGRGILSTIIYGCRTSLIVGFGVVLIAGTFGVAMGLLAGYYGGWPDTVIMLEATLSFLGVGVPLTKPSLGMMIAIGKNYIYAGMWWMIVFPGAALVLLVVGINLFADWLREELNPKIERNA